MSDKILRARIGGVTLRFRSDLDADLENLRMAFHHHLVDDDGPESDCHDVTFSGSSRKVVPKDAVKRWKGVYHAIGHGGWRDSGVTKYVSADGTVEYYETADGECLITDLMTMHTQCVLKEKQSLRMRGRVRSQVGSMMILMIHIVMAYHRRYSLHASAVGWKGKALLFMGRSGQGKSTLSTDLSALGADFLGDDIVFVYRDGGGIRLASLLFDAKLHEESDRKKNFVDIIERYGGNVIESLPLSGMAEVIQTREGETRVVDEDDGERLFPMILGAANNIAMQYDNDDWLQTCAELMAGYKLYTVKFGDRKLLKPEVLDGFGTQSE